MAGEANTGMQTPATTPRPHSSSAPSPSPARAPFRGPTADSRPGELLLDALPLACAVGHALDLSHCLALCGAMWRCGAQRADGSLDRTGFLGGANEMMAGLLERQAPWLAGAPLRAREAGGVTQLMRAAYEGSERRVRELFGVLGRCRREPAPADEPHVLRLARAASIQRAALLREYLLYAIKSGIALDADYRIAEAADEEAAR
jgi:hypothetical protein